MPPAREWPTKADEHRMDYIALSLDIQYLAMALQDALVAEEYERVAELNEAIYRKSLRQQELLQEARRKQ